VENETVNLMEECSAIIQKKLPPKLKDPGSFVIPCEMGKSYVHKALCDLGDSINLMPMSIFKKHSDECVNSRILSMILCLVEV